MAKLPLVCCAFLFFHFTESKRYTGTIYAHNWFKLWVNGKEVAVDPVVQTPQNAVKFTFEDDAACRTYAIFASDGVGTDTGLTPNDNCIERGGIRILIDDEVVSNEDWKFHRFHYGPTNWNGCGGTNTNCRAKNASLVDCAIQTYNITPNWCLPSTNNAVWNNVKEYTENEVGYGTKPPNTGLDSCVDPRTVDWGNSKFIWGTDQYDKSLEFDNDILFWYRKCDTDAVPQITEVDHRTCSMNKPTVKEAEACCALSTGNEVEANPPGKTEKGSGSARSSGNVVGVSTILAATVVSLSLLYY